MAAEASAELIAAEIIEGLAVGGGGGKSFGAEIFEQAAVVIVGAGLGDDVDHAARGAAIFGVGAAGDDLKFLYRFESDIGSRALAAGLLAEEAVVVITAVEADVVEYAALPVDIDFVAVGPLGNADAGCQGEQVFKLATQDRDARHRKLGEGGRIFCFGDFDNGYVGDHDLLGGGGNFLSDGQGEYLADGEIDVLLHDGGETGFGDGDGIASRGKIKKCEMAVAVGSYGARKIRIEISDFDAGIRNGAAAFVEHISFYRGGSDLRLAPASGSTHQHERQRKNGTEYLFHYSP